MKVADEYGEEYDEFRPGTGLKDDYDGTVNDGYFGTPQGGGDRLNMFLKVAAEDGDEVELRYSVGNGWTSYDGGKTVERSDGGERYFNNRTAWQTFISRCWTLEGCKEELGRRSHELERRGPRDSRLLIGMRFHFNVETETATVPIRDEMGIPTRDEKGQQITEVRTFPRVMPTAYLGTKDDAAPKAKASAKRGTTTGTAKTSETPSASDSNGGSTDAATLAKMKVYAKTKPYDEWVDAVMGLEGVLDDGELVGKLSDESFYESLKS